VLALFLWGLIAIVLAFDALLVVRGTPTRPLLVVAVLANLFAGILVFLALAIGFTGR
jgi:hypothetical protein